MPVTFFAHQAVVLPVARQRRIRVDGVAVVIGSMSPDFAYALHDSRFSVWAHGWPWVLLFCVPVTFAVAWLVVRLLAPFVADQLPDVAPWHLHDYRGLATHRFTWLGTPLWAFVGALSHVLLDHLTHDWGWAAHHVGGYDAVVIDGFLGRDVTVYRLVQYAGHVGLTIVCVWLLARYGRQRWMAARAARVPAPLVDRGTRVALAVAVVLGTLAGIGWATADRRGLAADIMRASAGAFAGAVLFAAGMWLAATRRQPQQSPSGVQP